ncbi:chaperone modulator CbpM [Endozoicomonas sp. 8E]|uniref:chaperone modulator CbpM n=1 Tax=Endozoicomonas sp. 8E TaxID=3035692 RepID=UPI002938E0FB|nr:chaperone modulator CbpM [Endozoicomonas sp. 8E]WOG25682.1 chaperone modulator CbpM [Endozoicomonas sp. 8E]
MNETQTTYLNFTEICLQTGVAEETIIEIIEQGIVEPIGTSPREWQFSPAMVLLTRKAVRLHDDLDVDWPGIALAIELLEKLDHLRKENHHLKRRLSRFIRG